MPLSMRIYIFHFQVKKENKIMVLKLIIKKSFEIAV